MPGFKALPIKTTSTAANLSQVNISRSWSCRTGTHVAVAANISTLLAELKLARKPAKSAVDPAAIPMRAYVFLTRYRSRIETTGKVDDRTVAMIVPARIRFDSS